MHRPVINWEKNKNIDKEGTIEHRIFQSTKKLIEIRRKIAAVGDYKNITWLTPHIIHKAGYMRIIEDQKLYCLFNFSDSEAFLTWYTFKKHGPFTSTLYDH
jgi:amylosucrase